MTRVLRGSSLTAQFLLGPAQVPFAKGHLDNGGFATVIDPGVLRAFLIPLPWESLGWCSANTEEDVLRHERK